MADARPKKNVQEVVAYFQDYYAKERARAADEDEEGPEEEEEEEDDDFDDLLDMEDHHAMQGGTPVASAKSLSQKDSKTECLLSLWIVIFLEDRST